VSFLRESGSDKQVVFLARFLLTTLVKICQIHRQRTHPNVGVVSPRLGGSTKTAGDNTFSNLINRVNLPQLWVSIPESDHLLTSSLALQTYNKDCVVLPRCASSSCPAFFFPRIIMNKALCNTPMYLTTDSCSDIAEACYLWWCSRIQASVLAFNPNQCGSALALMLSLWLKKVTCHSNNVSPHWNWGHTPTQPKKIYAINFFFYANCRITLGPTQPCINVTDALKERAFFLSYCKKMINFNSNQNHKQALKIASVCLKWDKNWCWYYGRGDEWLAACVTELKSLNGGHIGQIFSVTGRTYLFLVASLLARTSLRQL